MSIVTTGTLELVRQSDGSQIIEHWQAGGEIGYTLTGGSEYRTTLVGETWPHYRWTGKFRRQGRTLQIGFMMGLGLPGIPTAERILASAFSDAESVRWESFEGWADGMGYDREDEIEWKRARRIYNACEKMIERIERFIPSEYAREQWSTALEAQR